MSLNGDDKHPWRITDATAPPVASSSS
jgi:hypothetical protein